MPPITVHVSRKYAGTRANVQYTLPFDAELAADDLIVKLLRADVPEFCVICGGLPLIKRFTAINISPYLGFINYAWAGLFQEGPQISALLNNEMLYIMYHKLGFVEYALSA